MGSNFLQSGNNIQLTDGTAKINIQTATIQSLLPNLPVLTTPGKQLTSGLIQLSDCGFPVVTNSGLGVTGSIPVYKDGTGQVLQNSGTILSNVVSSGSTGATGSVVVMSDGTGKNIKDGQVLLSNLATTSQLNSYMPLSGGTFTGPVQMGSNVLTVNRMSTTGLTGQVWGNSSSGSTAGSIVIGDSSTGVGDICILGRNSFNTSSSDKSTLIGINNTAAAGATQSICLGFDNFCENNGGQICIGSLNTAQGLNSVCIGSGLINSVANSVLIGATGLNLVNIRPLSNATCDLGATSSNYFNNAYIAGNLSGFLNSRAVDNIVSNSGSAVSGNIASFSSDKVIQDPGISVSSISGGPFLPLAGGTMSSGPIDMNTNSITRIGSLIPNGDILIGRNITDSSPGSNIIIGNTASSASTGVVCIGDNANTPGLDCVAIGFGTVTGSNSFSTALGRNANANGGGDVALGNQSTSSAGSGVAIGSQSICAGTNSVSLGRASNCTNTGTQEIAIGYQATASGGSAIAIGPQSSASATDAISIGQNTSNSVANSCVIGQSSIANIRANNDSTCDLGTSGSSFKNLYLSGNVIGTGGQYMTKAIFSLTPGEPVDVSNTTTWTTVLGPGLGSLTFPANTTQGGTTLNIVGASRGNIDNGTTIGFALENAGNLIGLFYTNSSGGAQIGIVWMHIITLVIKGDGSAYMNWVINTFGGSGPVVQNSNGTFWDTTVDNTLDFQVHWDTATLTNTVNQQFLTIEQIF